jgi:polysaccharide pyruvyl transferase WcaK-like protein
MKNFINYLIIDKKMKVLLIPHVFELSNINQNDDLSYLSSIKSELGDYNGNLEIINNQYNAAEIKYIISKCSFFIGARMHSTIAAISTNVPTIFLAYSNKGIGMSKFIYDDLPLFIRMNDLNLELIKSKFNLLENNESSIRGDLKNKIPEIITTIEKGYSKIFSS